MVITFVDVSQLQVNQAEFLESQKELRRQARRLRTTTDVTPTMIAYVNSDLRYEFVNQRFAERFGRLPSELIGMAVPENLGPRTFAKVKPRIEAALRGEKSTFELEFQLPENNGRSVQGSELTCRKSRMNGKVVGYHVFGIDITERKRSALAEERLRLAAEAAGFGTYQIDLVTRANLLVRRIQETGRRRKRCGPEDSSRRGR